MLDYQQTNYSTRNAFGENKKKGGRFKVRGRSAPRRYLNGLFYLPHESLRFPQGCQVRGNPSTAKVPRWRVSWDESVNPVQSSIRREE